MDYRNVTTNELNLIVFHLDNANEELSTGKLGEYSAFIQKNEDHIINQIKLVNSALNDSLPESAGPYRESLLSLHKTMSVLSSHIQPKDDSPLAQTINKIKLLSNEIISTNKSLQSISMNPIEERLSIHSLSLGGSPRISTHPGFTEKIERAVKLSALQRIQKLLRLEKDYGKNDFVSKVKSLEADLNHLVSLYKGKKFSEVQEEVIKFSMGLADKYQEIGLDIMDFIPSASDSLNEETKIINNDIILNRVVNQEIFLSAATRFINLNKGRIIQEITHSPLPCALEDIKVEVKIFDVGGEGHNQGKKPLRIDFTIDNSSLSSVCKPRSAHIDQAVINTFNKINHLPKEERSSEDPLPTYTIIQPELDEGWEHLKEVGTVSIWEFVEGKTIKDKTKTTKLPDGVRSVSVYVGRNETREKNLRQKLTRMNTILSAMQITDLHPENVIERPKPLPVSLVPIDLEARGSPTLLGGSSDFPLTEKERVCIQEFNQEAKLYPSRIVLLRTQTLSGYLSALTSDINELDTIINALYKSIIAEYAPISEKEDLMNILENAFLEDALNHDVPYFTEHNGLIHYGLPERGIVIGKKIN